MVYFPLLEKFDIFHRLYQYVFDLNLGLDYQSYSLTYSLTIQLCLVSIHFR